MKPLKSKVSITLDEDIVTCVKELAEEDDRSFSQYINLVLKDYLQENSEYKTPHYNDENEENKNVD